MTTEAAVSTATVEAMLFASAEPVSADRIAEVLGVAQGTARAAVKALAADLEARGSGLMVEEVAGGYRLATRPEQGEAVERLLAKTRRGRLSPAALETLAVVAYRQPITRAAIEAIRGVDTGGVLSTLLERKFIKVVGTEASPGKALLYGTTKEFLAFFGLSSLKDLPPIEEFAEIARAKKEGEEDWDEFAAHAENERKRLEELAEKAGRELAEIEARYRRILGTGTFLKGTGTFLE